VEIRRLYREDKEKVTRKHEPETCPEQNLSVPFDMLDALKLGWIYNFGSYRRRGQRCHIGGMMRLGLQG
jgi:hypothetical protein